MILSQVLLQASCVLHVVADDVAASVPRLPLVALLLLLLLKWKGRKLDVIIALSKRPQYRADKAGFLPPENREALKRFTVKFWEQVVEFISQPSDAQDAAISTSRSSGLLLGIPATHFEDDPEAAACFVAESLQQRLSLSGRDMGSLQQLLASGPDATAEQLLPDLLAELWQDVLDLKQEVVAELSSFVVPKYALNGLLVAPSNDKYVRCVAVATFPPAWLTQQQQQQQQDTSDGATSASSSSRVMWVRPGSPDDELAYSQLQKQLWTAVQDLAAAAGGDAGDDASPEAAFTGWSWAKVCVVRFWFMSL
jgi:hypothetical protein